MRKEPTTDRDHNKPPVHTLAENDAEFESRIWTHILNLLNTTTHNRSLQIGIRNDSLTRRISAISKLIMCVPRSQDVLDTLTKSDRATILIPYQAHHPPLPTDPGSPLNRTFDLAISIGHMTHLSANNIRRTIRSMAHALKPEALCVIHYAERPPSGPPHAINPDDQRQYHEPYTITEACRAQHLTPIRLITDTADDRSKVMFARKRGT